MITKKKKNSEQRIRSARQRRNRDKLLFLIRLSKRKGFDVERLPCQAGYEQTVREVVKLGNGYLYRSAACSGCRDGDSFQSIAKKGELPDKILGCGLVEDNWLVSLDPIKVGDVVTAIHPDPDF